MPRPTSRSPAAAIYMALAAAALMPRVASAEEAKTPEVSIEQRGNITSIKTAGAGWGGVIKAVQALRAAPATQDAELIQSLTKDMDSLPPAYIYELARRTCASDPDRAIYLLYLAGMRVRYDALRCVDPTAQAGVTATLMSLPMPECKALSDKERITPALKALRASPQVMFASKESPWWICSHGMAAITAGLQKKSLQTSEWQRPESEWAGFQKQLLDLVDRSIENQSKN